MSLEEETVVITGGTRGLGRAMVLDFLEGGARVHATYRADEGAAESLREAAGARGERLQLARFDVADYAAVEAYWGELEEAAPAGVQVLVNNAGIRRDQILGMMSPEDWSRVLDTNLGGCFHMCKFAVHNMMRQRYGRILMVTSPAGSFGFAGQTNYAASKAGQVGLMRSLAKEVAGRGITVNCVSPGFIDTDLIGDLSEDVRKAHLASIPLKRMGRPEEVAAAVRFLASREASYVTGAVLEVTGGL